jgi:arginyl-tRNA synthetase
MQALGCPTDWLEIQILQQVTFLKDGRVLDMSKRKGQFVTMDALIDEVGADVAKYIFLTRKPNAHLEFDLDLAKEQSNENPVYYVKYAHARICSVLRNADAAGVKVPDVETEALLVLETEAEWNLVRELVRLPRVVVSAAEAREPHRLTGYAHDVAGLFHQFYHQCKILGEEPATTAARLQLCLVTRKVLATVLDLIAVEAPERMEEKD